MKPMKSDKVQSFNERAATWDADAGRVKIAASVTEAIRQSIPLTKNMTAMDFGCGSGLVTLGIQPHVGRIDALDVSDQMIEVLRRKISEQAIQTIFPQIIAIDYHDFGQDRYDLIFSSMSMHHVEDYHRLLEQFFLALKLGGYLAVADLITESGDFHSDNSVVEHFGFGETELKGLLAKIGFVQISHRVIHTIEKPGADGQAKLFPVFLITGKR